MQGARLELEMTEGSTLFSDVLQHNEAPLLNLALATEQQHRRAQRPSQWRAHDELHLCPGGDLLLSQLFSKLSAVWCQVRINSAEIRTQRRQAAMSICE